MWEEVEQSMPRGVDPMESMLVVTASVDADDEMQNSWSNETGRSKKWDEVT